MKDLRQEAIKALYHVRDNGFVMQERDIHRYIDFIENALREADVTIQELTDEIMEEKDADI